MGSFFVALLLMVSGISSAEQQLELDFGDGLAVLKQTNIYSANIRQSYDIPEEITKAWDERDFGFELGDGYYGYGPSAQYEILDPKTNAVIGYMLAQTLRYTEDPEYHVAYTISDKNGNTVVELEYDVVQESENESLPPELQWVDEDAY